MKESVEVKIFKALSNDQRLKLFKLIYSSCQGSKNDDNQCSRELRKAFTLACEHLNISKSTVSKHMKELVQAGLVNTRREGQYFVCEINMDAMNTVRNFLL